MQSFLVSEKFISEINCKQNQIGLNVWQCLNLSSKCPPFSRIAYSYADAVATGRRLRQCADQSGAIRESVVLSSGWRQGSGNGDGTVALAKCPRSRNQPDWYAGCLVASTAARWSTTSRPTAVQPFCEHSEPGNSVVETWRRNIERMADKRCCHSSVFRW